MAFQPMPGSLLQWQLHMLATKMLEAGDSISYIEIILENVTEILNEDTWPKYLDLHSLFLDYETFNEKFKEYKNDIEKQNLKAASDMKYREDVHIMEFVREQQNTRSLDEAKDIQRDLIRGERNELWQEADIAFTKAQEAKDADAISTASTYRQKLRDAPTSVLIADATTVEEIIPITLKQILES